MIVKSEQNRIKLLVTLPGNDEGGARPLVRPANGFEDITDERKDWPGLFPAAMLSEAVLLDTLGSDVTEADVARAGIEALRF